MTRKIILSFIVIISLLLFSGCQTMEKINAGNAYLEKGLSFYNAEEYEDAIIEFKQAEEIYRELAVSGVGEKRLSDIYLFLGYSYYNTGEYETALNYLTLSRELNSEYAEYELIAYNLHYSGNIYLDLGKIERALDCYNTALDLYINRITSEDKQVLIGRLLLSKGEALFAKGKYDNALECYKQADSIFVSLQQKDLLHSSAYKIGSVFEAWGEYTAALEYYYKSLSIVKETPIETMIPFYMNRIGLVKLYEEAYEEAITYFNDGLALIEGININYINILNSLGIAYYRMGEPEKALIYLEEVIDICNRLDNKSTIRFGINKIYGNFLINTGRCYTQLKQYDRALEFFKKAENYAYALEDNNLYVKSYLNQGIYYWEKRQYRDSVWELNDAINIIEEIRKTATGLVRRDYLATQIDAYRYLVSNYVRENLPFNALDAIQDSSTRYLTEILLSNLAMKETVYFDRDYSGIGKRIQDKMDEETGILVYSNVNWSAGNPVLILLTQKNIRAIELERTMFNMTVEKNIKKAMDMILRNIKKSNIIINENKDPFYQKKEGQKEIFEKIIKYYRYLLSTPNIDIIHKKQRDLIGLELYRLLIKPVEANLSSKTKLLIIPDGVLAFIPFETLIDEENSRLVEKYIIQYHQSLAVSEIISKRKYDSSTRKPFLGFGGAVYEEKTYKAGKRITEAEIASILDERGFNHDIYSRMGITWKNLPGTLKEIDAISKLIPEAEVYRGASVTETLVKSLSESSALKNYRVIHFATHGMVVPEYPELSSLVLSQTPGKNEKEDGYLQMSEINSLYIEADFVNLSACETGLGKVYAGEGCVGLTQAFLLAGANGLSVSLWSVADESTMKFMVGMYNLVANKGYSFKKAIHEMKLEFLRGNDFSNPFYWAAFVYYGN
jgi:CHAT domain-containing protein/predicted negative regulator of RcsB-dependent stress response